VLVSGDPRRVAAQTRVREWIGAGEDIHAPALLPYEVASGLTCLAAGGLFPHERVSEAWQTVVSLPITQHPLETAGDRVVEVALELRRQRTYDAAYIVLAQLLRAQLWTFDGPLARTAVGLGFPVHLIE
jgi:predicted nucleic acid-binding protein